MNWGNDGFEIKNFKDANGKLRSRPQNIQYFFKENLTWSVISSTNFGIRYCPKNFTFESSGSGIFLSATIIKYYLGLLTTKIVFKFLEMLNPTMGFQAGDISNIPVILTNNTTITDAINAITEDCISISKDDWDSFETSWDFEQHPLLRFKENGKVEDSFNKWKEYKQEQFNKLKANEEELNRLFIEIYAFN